MRRVAGVVAVVTVLVAGVALAQQPAAPGPDQGHQHMQGGMCPMMGMMGGGMMSGGMMGMMGGEPDPA
jgi:hypothetical protein